MLIRFFFVGYVFFLASVLIWKKELNPANQYLGIFAIFLSSFTAGMNISMAPSYAKAKLAANKIFEIIEEKSPIDTKAPKGEIVVKEGAIEFTDVEFRYPSRK